MAVSQSLTVTQKSQSVEGNYSMVRIYWTSTQSGESYNNYTKTAYYYVSVNGGSETTYSVSYKLPKGSTRVVVDTTIKVEHKTDGTGSVSVRTWMATGISAGTITKSQSLTLDTIPRATTPTLSASSADMGASVTISLPRASSSFTHDLAYQFNGGSWTSISTGVGTSYSWTVPDKATSIPNATSGTMRLRCITKSGSTTIGTKYVSLTAKVPSSVVPTVSAVAHTEATSGLAAQFGAYIRDKSKLTITVTASGAKSSTISEYQTTFQNKTYTTKSFTSDLLATAGTLTIKSRVKDSRGRWSSWKSVSITVLDYSRPKIQALAAYRCDSTGSAADDGTYIAVRYQYSVTSLNSKNTAAMAVKYKRSTATSYTSLLTGSALSANTIAKPSTPTFSTDYEYDLQLTVKDWFGAETVAATVLPSGKVILDIKADGLGIAFGKTAEEAGIDFGWDIVDQVKSFGALSGQYKTHDGLLLQWGNVTITPTAADTPTTAVVKFPLAYASTPITLATPVTSVPQSLSVSTQRTVGVVTDNTKAMAVTLTRSGTTATGIVWLAVGKGAE